LFKYLAHGIAESIDEDKARAEQMEDYRRQRTEE